MELERYKKKLEAQNGRKFNPWKLVIEEKSEKKTESQKLPKGGGWPPDS